MSTPGIALSTALALVLLAGAAVVAGQGTGRGREEPPLPPNLRHDVDAGNREWVTGFEAGDARLMARSYAADAVFCGPTGDCITGSAAITAHYEEVVRRFGRAVAAAVQSQALRVDGDLAFESGRARARFSDGRALAGRFSTVWKRQPDGHWKIFRNLSL